jgi:hypothetical protein
MLFVRMSRDGVVNFTHVPSPLVFVLFPLMLERAALASSSEIDNEASFHSQASGNTDTFLARFFSSDNECTSHKREIDSSVFPLIACQNRTFALTYHNKKVNIKASHLLCQ